METYLIDWANLLVRWLHLIVGIAWIGASFYFVWLDNSLDKPAPAAAARGMAGELWSVHGGGFYHTQKFPNGPTGQPLVEKLHWFKWEAYTTFLSGFTLLMLVYWHGAKAYLIDPSVLTLAPWQAIGLSFATLVAGWLVHNTYFTLPVLFAMISNHYPMSWSGPHGWLVLLLIMLAGALIRQFFVLRHKAKVQHRWWLAGVALLCVAGWIAAPKSLASADTGKVSFAQAQGIVEQRCIACHATHPTQEGFAQPPKGVILETAAGIATHVARINETVGSGYMPIGNLTHMSDAERQALLAWIAQGAHVEN